MQKLDMFFGAPPYIFEKVRELRRAMTTTEQQLWERLKKRQLNGYRFRRQHPMAEFIADFYCHSAKLVVEVDGGIHETRDRKEYDVLRTEKLNQFGIRVIRFTSEEVENKVEQVIEKVKLSLDN